MAECAERLATKWDLRPVPVCLVDKTVPKLYARFLAYGVLCSTEKLEEFAKKHALPKVVLEGDVHLGHDDSMTVAISSPVGTFTPQSFIISKQQIIGFNKIYCKLLELSIEQPLCFDVDHPVELLASVAAADDTIERSVHINWPCMNRTVVNASPHSVGIQHNYYFSGNDPAFLPRFQADDTSDSTCKSIDSSTPLVKPAPVWQSPASSGTTSPYLTPPESLESTPPKFSIASNKGSFSPIKNLHPSPDEDDSGISSLLSNLSFPSSMTQLSSQSGQRSHRGSESEVCALTLNLSTSQVEPTPRKSRCQSVPNTPNGGSVAAGQRPSSCLPRRKLYSPIPKKGEKPPWKP